MQYVCSMLNMDSVLVAEDVSILTKGSLAGMYVNVDIRLILLHQELLRITKSVMTEKFLDQLNNQYFFLLTCHLKEKLS